MNFASNSALDDKGHPLPDSPPHQWNTNFAICFWLREVSRFIKSLDSTKATGLDKIHVVVLKNLSLDLSPILAKLFNHFLKKMFLRSMEGVSCMPSLQECG